MRRLTDDRAARVRDCRLAKALVACPALMTAAANDPLLDGCFISQTGFDAFGFEARGALVRATFA